jgi:hypothetical protein
MGVPMQSACLVAAMFAFAMSMLIPADSAAQSRETVDLELVLAVDVSRSMDMVEQGLQREGYVQAFRSPEVVAAITSGLSGRIAVTYMEWAGASLQNVIVPWTIIDSAESAARFADALSAQVPQRLSRTSISGAISASGALFGGSGYSTMRRVIDISGDGPNNHGIPVTLMRDEWVGRGVVINGLPLMISPSAQGFGIANLDEYYADCVVGGPASFVLPVYSWAEFPRAVRQKLVLEIAGVEPDPKSRGRGMAVPVQAQRQPVDCMIGEKLWERRMREMEWQ